MSGKPGRHLRVGVSGAFVVLTGAAVYWAALPHERLTTHAPAVAGVEALAPAATHAANLPPPAEPTSSALPAPADTEQATVAQYTAQKYQFLLEDLHAPQPDRALLLRALLSREEIAGQPDSESRRTALAAAEARIRGLLHPADFATYEALSESDLEQFHLDEYAGGISNVAPLSPDDRKSILRTKLAYKARFRQLVQDSGLLRDDLGAAERVYAYGVVSSALRDYQRSYLQEVRQYLSNDEQFTLLSNYENTEFSAELAKLQALAPGEPTDSWKQSTNQQG